MRISEAFVVGTIMGGLAVWFWGREIEGYVGEKTRGVRAQAAGAMRAVRGEDRAGTRQQRELSSSRRRRLAEHEGARQHGPPSRARRDPARTDNQKSMTSGV